MFYFNVTTVLGIFRELLITTTTTTTTTTRVAFGDPASGFKNDNYTIKVVTSVRAFYSGAYNVNNSKSSNQTAAY